MVATRRSGSIEHRGVSLRAAASQRQQQRQAGVRQRRNAAAAASTGDMSLPGVYRDMLIEAGVPSPAARRVRNRGDASAAVGEPPVKRMKRPGQKSEASTRGDRVAQQPSAAAIVVMDDDDNDEDGDEDEDEGMEFEDIVIPEPVIQTTELDSEDDDDGDDDGDGDGDEDEDEDEDENVDESGEQSVFQDVSLAGTPTKQGNNTGGDVPQQVTAEGEPRTLELNLTAHEGVLTTPVRRGRRGGWGAPANRKKPLSRAERMHRLGIHKMHVLCLLAHAAQRNRWCNLEQVQAALRPLLTDKMIAYLNPSSRLTQFGQTESLKTGLQMAATMFKMKFSITERGLRRALWAENLEQLKDYELPSDIESVLDKDDFIEAAKSLQGSRDVGAQLFCAFLRTAGVEARLVCSLQPLPFVTNAPTLPKPKGPKATPSRPIHPIPSVYQSPPAAPGQGSSLDSESEAMFTSPRRRLGHPDAAAYNIPSTATPPRPRQRTTAAAGSSSSSAHVVRGESAFPVYWVEVLDVAHQKWQPIDPLVTSSQWRPAKLEPPASDKNNQLSYAIGFAAEGDAKDVTRRYAKAYNAKTKRGRVDGFAEPTPTIATATAAATATAGGTASPSPSTTNLVGSKWLRRALRHYRESYPTDVDQIEDIELKAAEGREPMPRNVADFQNHPVYALVRHLRRHEVLIPNATAAGTVSAGAKAPLERIYRRRDVRIAYSADRWYRLGRVVNPNEIPVKWLPKPVSRKRGLFADDDDVDDAHPNTGGVHTHDNNDDLFGDNDDGDAGGSIGRAGNHPSPLGIPIFTPEQTELYRARPVVDGRIPKNKFGNIDLYVPSMVPAGGQHVAEDGAARAAFLLGVDYAPALAGFNFEGRRGTAVLRGAVVATEYADAVRAVVAGLQDLAVEAEAERRSRAALRVWTAFLRGLRIRQRIRIAAEDRGEDVDSEEGEEGEEEDENDDENDNEDDNDDGKEDDDDIEDAKSDVTEEYDMVMDDGGDGEYAGGGGFLNEDDDDFGGGGFIPE